MTQSEIRDPIHNFIRLDSEERMIVDSEPFQRLRQIHQLALTYLVYPGATHRRFEHSLGVMELASRIFDTVTEAAVASPHSEVRDLVPGGDQLRYWRRVLRLAALLHDIGHLPFSHAAEDLLPEGWNHERLTAALVLSDQMAGLWSRMTPPVKPEDVAKLALGRKIVRIPELRNPHFSAWEGVLAEIIVGDAFGADRMDYLLRDSLHAGVAYGRFDHYRLIDTMRILPGVGEELSKPELGVEVGGLQAAESLLWARYLMYSQVYFHHVRRIYDIHLKDFFRSWLVGGCFSTTIPDHLALTDNEVAAAMLKAARAPSLPGHDPAVAILERRHFRRVYSRNPDDQAHNPQAGRAIAVALRDAFGDESVRHDSYRGKGSNVDFPVLLAEGEVTSSRLVSSAIQSLPEVAVDHVFVSPEVREEAERWLKANKQGVVRDGVPREE